MGTGNDTFLHQISYNVESGEDKEEYKVGPSEIKSQKTPKFHEERFNKSEGTFRIYAS